MQHATLSPPTVASVWRHLALSPGRRDVLTPVIEVRVLGELEVLAGGAPGGAGLRRNRVRTMLELLVLLGTVRRERLADLMWPELDAAAAGANLRVTLTRLRAALDPTGRARSSVIDADSQRVSLGAAGVHVDLFEFDHQVAVADAAQRAGNAAAAIDALQRGCRWWRGEPFANLGLIDAVAPEVEHVRRRVAAAASSLATLLCDAGRFDEAARWAERVRQAAPYDERAHRLAIAAHLGSGNHAAAGDAARRTVAMLDEIGVAPCAATEVLLRRCVCAR